MTSFASIALNLDSLSIGQSSPANRIHLEGHRLAPGTINVRLIAVRQLAYEAENTGLLSPELAAGIRRVKGLLEGSDRKRQVVVGREKIQQSHHFKCLQGKFSGFEQPDGPSTLFCRCQIANQHANTTGVDDGHLLQIENYFVVGRSE